MKERIINILNLKVSESKFVFDLLSIQLFIGIATSLINIVAITFFIHHFAVYNIAWAYVVIAVLLSLVNIGYEKLEKQLSPLHLLRWVIIASSAILFLFWTGLFTLDQSAMIFSLLVASMLFYMVTGYAYWGLVSLLFNVRESKRVFSIVGSGDIPAKMIGYMLVPLLIPVIGLENLILVAILTLGVGFFLVNKVIHKKSWERITHRSHGKEHHGHHHHQHNHAHGQEKDSLLSFFFKHKLIFTISLLSLLSYNVFNLIDYTFITQVKYKSKNIATLATYISIFFATGRLIAIVLKLVFTSRVIERLGIISCLLITPVVLFLSSMAFMFSPSEAYTLYAFGIMAMLTEVLRSAMQEPVFFILFQPLNEHNRLRGHIIAKGYMLAPSLLIVGASLLIMREVGVQLTIDLTVKLLLLNLCVWAGIIFYIRRAYAKTLHSSISKGVFNAEGIKIFDQTTINILLEKISKGNIAEKIYALKLLENSGYSGTKDLLQNELQNGSPELKKYALTRLDEINALNPQILEDLVYSEKDEGVKELVIATLCKHDPQFLRSLSTNLSTLDYSIRKHLIILLLNQNEFNYLYKGGNELNALIRSNLVEERELAVDIISNLKNITFTEAIEDLINDPSVSVRRLAITAACKLKSKTLLPFVLNRLTDHSDKYIAMQGLFQYGDVFFEDVKQLEGFDANAHKLELIKVAAKVKGPLSTKFLIQSLGKKQDSDEKVIHALWSKSYQAESVEDIYLFDQLLAEYLRSGTRKIHYHVSVPDITDHELIKSSIGSEIWNDLVTALKICGILYPRKEINRVIELIDNRDDHRLYNGMEMLEMVLPKKTARQLNELFDYVLDPEHHKHKAAQSSVMKFMDDIVVAPVMAFNCWTKSVCMFVSYRNNEVEFISKLSPVEDPNENIVFTETKTYVINNVQPALC